MALARLLFRTNFAAIERNCAEQDRFKREVLETAVSRLTDLYAKMRRLRTQSHDGIRLGMDILNEEDGIVPLS